MTVAQFGLQPIQALDVIGQRLSKEFDDRDLAVTDKAAAESFGCKYIEV